MTPRGDLRAVAAIVTMLVQLCGACGRIGFDDLGSFPVRTECDTDVRASSITRPLPPFEEGRNYRSIGTLVGPLVAAGTATVVANSRTVVFQGGVVPASVGIGDRLLIGGEELFVQRVESTTTLTVQTGAVSDHVDAAFELTRAYNTLQAWETARQGDLVAEDRIEVGVAYNDGPFSEGVVISGSTTNETHFMWLTVAPGHRHDGTPRTGTRIRTDGAGGADLVRIVDAYVRVHWLELDCARTGGWVGHGVLLGYRGDHAELSNLLVYDGEFAAIRIADYVQGTVIRNTIISDMVGHPAAIVASGPHNGEVAYFYGNSVFRTELDGVGAYTDLRGPFWFEAWNNIVMESGGDDFSDSPLYGCSGHNLSSDRTAPGDGAVFESSPDAVFRSTAVGGMDLHLAPGGPAIDQGVDLSFAFVTDVDDEPRPGGVAWDLGADEFHPTSLR